MNKNNGDFIGLIGLRHIKALESRLSIAIEKAHDPKFRAKISFEHFLISSREVACEGCVLPIYLDGAVDSGVHNFKPAKTFFKIIIGKNKNSGAHWVAKIVINIKWVGRVCFCIRMEDDG